MSWLISRLGLNSFLVSRLMEKYVNVACFLKFLILFMHIIIIMAYCSAFTLFQDQGKTRENTDKRKKGTRESGNKSIRNMAEEVKCSNKLEVELRRLKREYEAALEKNSEVTAVLAEKKFVWNQYKIMEDEYINKLRSKDCELELASEKIERLVSSMEQLLSANDEKDGTISRLESKVASMEADTKRLNEELLKLSNELGLLRKSRNTEVTPDLNRCNNSSRRRTVLKKEMPVPKVTTDSAKYSEKVRVLVFAYPPIIYIRCVAS